MENGGGGAVQLIFDNLQTKLGNGLDEKIDRGGHNNFSLAAGLGIQVIGYFFIKVQKKMQEINEDDLAER